MFGSIRQGHILARSLQRVALRSPLASAAVTQPLRTIPKTPLLSRRTIHATTSLKDVSRAAAAPSFAEDAVEQRPLQKFSDLAEMGVVAPPIIKTITKDMGLDTMTEIQAATIQETVKGLDL